MQDTSSSSALDTAFANQILQTRFTFVKKNQEKRLDLRISSTPLSQPTLDKRPQCHPHGEVRCVGKTLKIDHSLVANKQFILTNPLIVNCIKLLQKIYLFFVIYSWAYI